MRRVTRHILLLAVVLLVARPAMACCWLGHADAADTTPAPTVSMPCHGEMAAMQPAEPLSEHGECPGCGDCETRASVTDVLDAFIAVQLLADIGSAGAQIAGLNSRVMGRSPRDGPQPSLLLTSETPITLKQRLLI